MNRKTFLIVLSIIIFSFSSNVFAQIETPPPPPPTPIPTRIAGGVVNGKALSLPKPVYPAAALAANIQGSVNVAVVIGKNGEVMSAEATSGHPLLRDAAVSAARLAQFAPTILSGQPVEVSGVVVYNFGNPAEHDETDNETEDVSPTGTTLTDNDYDDGEVNEAYKAPADETGNKSLKDFPVLASSILLSAFEYMGEEKEFSPVLLEYIKNTPNLSKKSEIYTDFTGKTFEGKKAIVVKLQGFLRQSPDSSEVWQYKIGVSLGQIMGQFGNFEKDLKLINPKELRVLLKKVEDLNYSSPTDFPEKILEKFVSISQYAEHENLGTIETQKEIFRIMKDSF